MNLMSSNTAGKGPGVVMRAANRSGALRVRLATSKDRALLELQEFGGPAAEIGLSAEELRTLARALNQVASALGAAKTWDEETVRLYPGH